MVGIMILNMICNLWLLSYFVIVIYSYLSFIPLTYKHALIHKHWRIFTPCLKAYNRGQSPFSMQWLYNYTWLPTYDSHVLARKSCHALLSDQSLVDHSFFNSGLIDIQLEPANPCFLALCWTNASHHVCNFLVMYNMFDIVCKSNDLYTSW